MGNQLILLVCPSLAGPSEVGRILIRISSQTSTDTISLQRPTLSTVYQNELEVDGFRNKNSAVGGKRDGKLLQRHASTYAHGLNMFTVYKIQTGEKLRTSQRTVVRRV